MKARPATAEGAETLREVLRALETTARSGAFFPMADSCEFCPYTGVCGGAREERAGRKKGDPRIAPFVSLRRIP